MEGHDPRKSLGAFIVNSRKSKKMALCESALDAISVFMLLPWCVAVSTSGVSADPAWLGNVLSKGYEVFCGFDSDETGERFVRKMIWLHPSVKRPRPERRHQKRIASRFPTSRSLFNPPSQTYPEDPFPAMRLRIDNSERRHLNPLLRRISISISNTMDKSIQPHALNFKLYLKRKK